MYTTVWANDDNKKVLIDYTQQVKPQRLMGLGKAGRNYCVYAGMNQKTAQDVFNEYVSKGYESVE